MRTVLTKRWGEGVRDPSLADLEAALAELEIDDEEHPDCWLSDENGWAISSFGSGLVILENAETNEGPWHMKGVAREKVLELWILLTAGELEEVKKLAWKKGYKSDS